MPDTKAASGPVRRKSADGRPEVLVDGRWLPEDDPGVMAAFAREEGAERSASSQTRQEPRKEPTAKQRAAWDAVKEHGTQGAAARALGISQGGVQTALRGYMKAKSIEGPMPGYRSKGKGSKSKPSKRFDVKGHDPASRPPQFSKSAAAEAAAHEHIADAAEDIPPDIPVVSGTVAIEVQISLSVTEMASWEPSRISALFAGVAQIKAALRDAR